MKINRVVVSWCSTRRLFAQCWGRTVYFVPTLGVQHYNWEHMVSCSLWVVDVETSKCVVIGSATAVALACVIQ